MDKLAFVMGDRFIYWNSIVLTLGALVAICFFLSFYIGKGGNAVAGFTAVPIAIVMGLVFARFFHWYCRADSYESFSAAMTNYTSGGYALMGVFLGCFLTAALLRLIRLHRSLPEMLDCMCIAGCAGIAVGRLASFFNASDRGNVLETFHSLPFAYPVTNAVSGAVEYRLATFVIQAMVAAVLFLILAVFYVNGTRDDLKDGDTTLLFLMIYGSSQVVLDSTRYDSLFFRSNGFVSVVQVLGALGLGLAIVLYSVRLVKARGFKVWQVPLWTLIAAGIGCGGFMEYYVQRRGNEALFAYSVMSICLMAVIALTLLIRGLAVAAERKKNHMLG
ncbi:MAG: prolipoprotein diacylglyceryl transferase [Oscillospiraceae bacterium]|nr:prolipoprotein diacylglyceryl transferase [Oscillospiraceae bacterium]